MPKKWDIYRNKIDLYDILLPYGNLGCQVSKGGILFVKVTYWRGNYIKNWASFLNIDCFQKIEVIKTLV